LIQHSTGFTHNAAVRRVLVALFLAVMLIALIAGGVHQAAAATSATPTPTPPTPLPPGTTPVLKMLKPTPGQVLNWWGVFDVSWTRIPDTVFYRVQIFLPAGAQVEFIEHRYVPNTNRDRLRYDPVMQADAGQLVKNADHTITVTAYGLSQKLMDTYGAPDPKTGIWPYYPTHLSLDWYTQIGQPASVKFFVDP
jgi:hypothetical protein